MTNDELEQVKNVANNHGLIRDDYADIVNTAIEKSRQMLAGMDWIGGIAQASFAAFVCVANGEPIEYILDKGVATKIDEALGVNRFSTEGNIESMALDMGGALEISDSQEQAFDVFRARLFNNTNTGEQIAEVVRVSVEAIAEIEKSGAMPDEYVEERFDWCVDVADKILREIDETGDEEDVRNFAKMFSVIANAKDISMAQKVIVFYGNFLAIKNALGILTNIVPEDGNFPTLGDNSINFLSHLQEQLKEDDHD